MPISTVLITKNERVQKSLFSRIRDGRLPGNGENFTAKQEGEKDTLLSVYGKFRKAWFPATVFPSHPVAAGRVGRHCLPKFPDHLQLQHAR